MWREEIEDTFWVFAYGSLMWKPGFRAAETRRATVHGYHRDVCLLSYRYRGTKKVPGMVLGLDRGGSCHGVDLRVAKSRARAVADYLHERELTGGVYQARHLAVRLDDGRRVRALAFVVRRDHPQYAGDMTLAEKIGLIRAGIGTQGSARDYLANTVAHLEEMELADHSLHRLLAKVDRQQAARR